MIGNHIKNLLKANEMTQTQLAQKMNISESKMSKILSGTLEPNITDLKLMAKIFDVTIDEIVVGETKTVMSAIEVAVKDGIETFSKLIKADPSWVDRKDDKGFDMLYYIKKYDAYDLLTYFYQPRNTHVPSAVQIYYVKMVKTLIKKKLYESYLEIDRHKHLWDFSALNLSLKDQEKINYSYSNSREKIYEVIKKNGEKSEICSVASKNDISRYELEKHIIYGYPKRVFRELCNQLLIKQNTEPKYIVGPDRQKEYLKTYYANNPKVLNNLIKDLKDKNTIPSDMETIKKALFLAGDKERIVELMSYEIDLFEDVDFKEVRINNNAPRYMDVVYKHWGKVSRIKNYLSLCIKYNDLDLFTKLISNPKLKLVIDSARKKKYVYDEYPTNLAEGKFFDFDMPFIFQKEVLEIFPESIDEITFNYEEIIKSENASNYKYAIDHLSKQYFVLPFYAELDIEDKLNRPLTILDYRRIIDTIHSVIQEFLPSYLETGKLDYDSFYKSLLDKSLKNPALKYTLVKIWINSGDFRHLSSKDFSKLFDEGIASVEKIKSAKVAALDLIFFNMPTYIDNLFINKKLFSLLPKIENINFFKIVVSGFNPNIFGKYIKENNIVFADIEKIKFLYKKITNQLSNDDLAMLYRTLL